MPGTQIQGQSQGVQQPQQNFANQQTQPTSTLQGNITITEMDYRGCLFYFIG
jgi:hypothetical protein